MWEQYKCRLKLCHFKPRMWCSLQSCRVIIFYSSIIVYCSCFTRSYGISSKQRELLHTIHAHSPTIYLNLSLCLSFSHNRLHESKRINWKRICTFESASICTFVPEHQHRPALLQQPSLSCHAHHFLPQLLIPLSGGLRVPLLMH